MGMTIESGMENKSVNLILESIDAIFDQRMKDGQLDECGITMEELHIVKTAYIDLLRGAFHPRVQYPEPKKSE